MPATASTPQSFLSTIIGSTALARRAGTKAAAADTASMMTPATTDQSRVPHRRVGQQALREPRRWRTTPTRPIAAPRAASRRPSPSTRLITRPASAPSARRTPMSRIRDETEYESMPYTPIAASSSAAPANEASSVALNRGRDDGRADPLVEGHRVIDGQRRVDRRHCRAHRRQQRRRRAARLDDHHRVRIRELQIGRVEIRPVRPIGLIHALVLHVARDADDLDRTRRIRERPGRRAEPDALADGILAGPEPARARFVHDRDRRAARAIGGRERPAGEDRDAERAEVVGGNVVPADARRARGIDRAAGQEQDRSRTAAERRAPIDRGRFDAGHGLDAREQAVHRGRTRRRPDSASREAAPRTSARRRTRSRCAGSGCARSSRSSSPDAVSSRHAIATSVTTRIESARPRRPPPRSSSLSAVTSSRRDAASAGTSANSSVVPNATARANSSTTGSSAGAPRLPMAR